MPITCLCNKVTETNNKRYKHALMLNSDMLINFSLDLINITFIHINPLFLTFVK